MLALNTIIYIKKKGSKHKIKYIQHLTWVKFRNDLLLVK